MKSLLTLTRRDLLAVLALAGLTAPGVARAQQTEKVSRLGFLGVANAARFERFVAAMRLGLREHGYVEGKNITIEFRWAEGRYDRLPALAEELVRLNPDVIITHGTPGTLALKGATSTIPIVMAIIGNPVEAGAVASLARPGGNITGSSFLSDEVTVKRLDILKTALPSLARVGFLVNPDNRASPSAVNAMNAVAQALNVKVQRMEMRSLDNLDAAFTVAKTQVDAVVLPDEQLFTIGGALRRIADLAMRKGMPSVGPIEFADAGGLLGYGVDWPDVVRRSMAHVDRIPRGAKPAGLPVEQASKFELVINLKTAQGLGVTIAPPVLARADRAIE